MEIISKKELNGVLKTALYFALLGLNSSEVRDVYAYINTIMRDSQWNIGSEFSSGFM